MLLLPCVAGGAEYVGAGQTLDELAIRLAPEEPHGSNAFEVYNLLTLRAAYEAECHIDVLLIP